MWLRADAAAAQAFSAAPLAVVLLRAAPPELARRPTRALRQQPASPAAMAVLASSDIDLAPLLTARALPGAGGLAALPTCRWTSGRFLLVQPSATRMQPMRVQLRALLELAPPQREPRAGDAVWRIADPEPARPASHVTPDRRLRQRALRDAASAHGSREASPASRSLADHMAQEHNRSGGTALQPRPRALSSASDSSAAVDGAHGDGRGLHTPAASPPESPQNSDVMRLGLSPPQPSASPIVWPAAESTSLSALPARPLSLARASQPAVPSACINVTVERALNLPASLNAPPLLYVSYRWPPSAPSAVLTPAARAYEATGGSACYWKSSTHVPLGPLPLARHSVLRMRVLASANRSARAGGEGLPHLRASVAAAEDVLLGCVEVDLSALPLLHELSGWYSIVDAAGLIAGHLKVTVSACEPLPAAFQRPQRSGETELGPAARSLEASDGALWVSQSCLQLPVLTRRSAAAERGG